MKIEKKTLIRIFLGVAACIVLYFLLHEAERVKAIWNVIRNIFSPFVIGAALAFVLNVPMRAIERRLTIIKGNRLCRFIALILTFLAFALLMVLVFYLLIPQISLAIQTLIPKIVSFFKDVEIFITDFLKDNSQLMDFLAKNTELENINWSSLIQQFMAMLSSGITTIAGGAVSVIDNVSGAVVDAVISFVFGLYCLFNKETLARQGRRLLYAFIPERVSDETIRILRLTNSTFSSFISGQCLEACILGGLFAIAMAIFRMPYILLISVLIGVTSLVPLVGAFVGCFVGAFFILVDNPIQAAWFVVMFLVIQQIEGNLIYPKVVGNSIGLPGMWVLLAVAVGGELMGVAGMLLMIPLTSVVYTLLREITNHNLKKKGILPEKLQEQPIAVRSIQKKPEKSTEEKGNP